MNIISVQPITDRPIIDAIAPDDFMLIGDASDNNVVKRVLVSSLKSFFTIASNLNYIAVLANRLLESNKSYLATVSGLTLLLPLNPNIGDKIELATGNFDLMVEQNTNQIIQNLSTLTTLGDERGVILKPYSSICLVFVQSELWVSSSRNRIINNYQTIKGDTTNILKSYIPILQDGAVAAHGTDVYHINNNELAIGYPNNGLLVNSKLIRILIQFATQTKLGSFDFYAGQGNEPTGGRNYSCYVTNINVYSGNTLNNLIGAFNPTSINSTKQTFNVLDNNSPTDTYIFEFNNIGEPDQVILGILELDLFGKAQTGGEVIAV